jgi:hypothetical protein
MREKTTMKKDKNKSIKLGLKEFWYYTIPTFFLFWNKKLRNKYEEFKHKELYKDESVDIKRQANTYVFAACITYWFLTVVTIAISLNLYVTILIFLIIYFFAGLIYDIFIKEEEE